MQDQLKTLYRYIGLMNKYHDNSNKLFHFCPIFERSLSVSYNWL